MAREIRAPEQVTGSATARLDGYAEGMADGTRVLAEWCRRHVDWGDGGGDGE